jgi:ribosome-binding factor A
MDERRTARVSEAIREEISEMLGFEMDDPRLASVIVTDVQVTPDGRHAQIRVGIRGDEREQRKAIQALDRAGGYLRRELASRLSLRHVPELHFDQDRAPDTESRLDLLLRRARRLRPRD